ncbi:MAG: thiamine diphosphokinase [Clostridiales Family XIII bacterium]|jgi:thiamine pyrophosphokinase|nr:thiamine diphosphokinase [Clostridiales Family XIII bacterium]
MNKNQKRPLEAGRCVIFTGYIESDPGITYTPKDGDFVICADGGYAKALSAGIIPAAAIGDFDSFSGATTPGVAVYAFPPEKDDTDTGLALKHGLDLGYRDFLLVGGIGGRLDHTLANLQLMSYCLDHGGRVSMEDAFNIAIMTDDACFCLPPRAGYYFSVLSWSLVCEGVCIENAKYPLSNYKLNSSFPIGISNEFLEAPAIIRKTSGRLLILLSADRPPSLE